MTSWIEDDDYDRDIAFSRPLDKAAGPHGVACLNVYEGGRTTPGWGQADFMARYERADFRSSRRVRDYTMDGAPFALVMRSLDLVCIDLDRHAEGADGVLTAVQSLDLPPTLAETSKSGEGRHLFYRTNDTWDAEKGFALYGDAIGIEPGVDIRSVGCVYHYSTQRWNRRPIADIPQWLAERLEAKKHTRIMRKTSFTSVADGTADDEEIMIMMDALNERLKQDIPAGKRNNTLFSLGSDLKEAGYPDWDKALEQKALAVGLDPDEANKIISNVEKYS